MNGIMLVYDAVVPLNEALLDVAIGFSLVVAMLVLLIAIFWVFGRVMVSASTHGKRKAVEPKKQTAPKAPTAPLVTKQPTPVVSGGVSEEVVAVIAAAVASMAPTGKQYTVRRISRTRADRPVWAAAGVMENTRPF